MTSPDGITWTSRALAANNNWNSVTYGNGLFVAVNGDSATTYQVMTSPDGITWTSRTAAANNSWNSVTYGNGLFVAVSSTGTGNRVMAAPAFEAAVGSVLAAQDTVLTNTTNDSVRLRMNVGVSGNNIWRAGSTDQSKLTLQYALRSGGVCSAGDTYYDVTTAAWNAQTSPADNNWYSIAYGNGLFVALAQTGTGNRVMTSPDGINWTTNAGTGDNTWQSITYGNGQFVAVGFTSSNTGAVMTSPDGINWTSRTAVNDNAWRSVTYGNGLYVAVASNNLSGNQVMTSPDGINWTARASAANDAWQSITYGNGTYVAVSLTAGTANQVMTSPDGITWTMRTSAFDNSWYGITYGNGLFVAVGAGPAAATGVMTSPDGINWTSRASAANNFWRTAAYGNGLFVAVAYSGTGNRVMTSPDGITWTSRTSAADNNWYGVAYGNGQFVAVASTGTGNRVMTMSPAVLWGGSTANNYGTVTDSANDPTQGAATVRKQQYVTNNYFTNYFDTAVGEYGQFDFDLDMSKATYQNTYCFRIVQQDGSVLNSYGVYPEITRCTVPPLDLRLRHNAAFCAGSKRFYWSRAGQ